MLCMIFYRGTPELKVLSKKSNFVHFIQQTILPYLETVLHATETAFLSDQPALTTKAAARSQQFTTLQNL